jgi:hypothetical protein
MLKKWLAGTGVALLVPIITVLVLQATANDSAKKEDTQKMTATPVVIHTQPMVSVRPPLPEEIYFAGERVPVEMEDVRERLERELVQNMYAHSVTCQIIKRSNRWKEKMVELLKANRLPEDFYYLMVCESAIRNATSPMGAKGYWQFLAGTAKEYGLEVNQYVDERNHPLKAAQAAIQYLKEAQNRYKSWTLAAAAYNMGMGGLDNVMAYQQEKNYYDLYLNSETSRYIFRIIALKLLLEAPEKYGFKFEAKDLYQPLDCKTITVTESITDLVAFAKNHQTNFKMLKMLNPWIIADQLPVKNGKTYQILIPANAHFQADTRFGLVE